MKNAIVLIGMLVFSQLSLAATHVCKIQELSYNGIGTVIVSTHTIEANTLDKIILELGFTNKKLELKRTLIEENLELVSVIVSDPKNSENSEGGMIMSETIFNASAGKSISVSCSKEKY